MRLLDLVTGIGIGIGVGVGIGVDAGVDADAGFFESLLSVMGSLSAFPMTAIETATATVAVAVAVFKKIQMDSNLFDSLELLC